MIKLGPSLLAALVFLAALPSSAAPPSAVYVLGDSLSDSGNVAIATAPFFQNVPFGGLIPSLAYQSGRFSDGPVWIEQLALELGLAADPYLGGGTNYAVGGARTGPPGQFLPSLRDQAAFLLSDLGGTLPPDALYVVWGGSNDTRDAAGLKLSGDDPGVTSLLQDAADNLGIVLDDLATAGATLFLMGNVPDLGMTPEALRGPPGLASASRAVSIELNGLLEDTIADFTTAHPGARVSHLDAFTGIAAVAASPATYGLANVTDPCVDLASVCSDPDLYLFYDGIHPTSRSHGIAAELALVALAPDPVDLLRVNGSPDQVVLSTGEPISIELSVPVAGPPAPRYLLYVWPDLDLVPVALRVGGELLGSLAGSSRAQPGFGTAATICVRGTGIPGGACRNLRAINGPGRLPLSLSHGGVSSPLQMVLQAIVEDDGAVAGAGFSVSNRVALVVE